MPKYDEESLERYFARMTPEQRQKAQEVLAKAGKRDQSMQELEKHPRVEEVHSAIEKAAEETGASTDNIRLAEVNRYVEDLPAYENLITKLTEEWKRKNATHRNPKNPFEYWYSPKRKGNPPGWIRDALGKTPHAIKEPEKYAKWLEDLAQFEVKRNEEDKME
jgi:hypothetical protein